MNVFKLIFLAQACLLEVQKPRSHNFLFNPYYILSTTVLNDKNLIAIIIVISPCIGYSVSSQTTGVRNDPHFLLPLLNGEYLCFSIQGQPNFAFSLIRDKYIQLNGQFVQPAEEESHTIANISTFLGDLGLVVKNPETGNTTVNKVSAQDHSVAVGNSLTIVKDKQLSDCKCFQHSKHHS